MKNTNIYDLSFNTLNKEKRLELLKPTFQNPFEIKSHEMKMFNPFSYNLKGKWNDGEHIIHNIQTLLIYKKLLVKNNKVIKLWKVNDNNEYELIN